MNTPAQQFTANQISAALKRARPEIKIARTKRAVLAALHALQPSSQVIVSGNAAAAWTLESLPQRFRDELKEIAKRDGYRDELHVLSSPPKQHWPLPGFPTLSEIAGRCIDHAAKLQLALAPGLARADDPLLSEKRKKELGVEDYQKVFGYRITERHWWGLFDRTLDRDGGAQNFARLELYLDERPARKEPLPSRPRPGDEVQFRELRDVLATFKNPTAPTDAELQYIWLRSFEIFQASVATGKPAKRTQRALVRFLFAVLPSLAKHEAALRKTFKRKLARWQENEQRIESLADKRAEKSGFHRAPELPESARMLLTAASAKFGGGMDQAWQMCHSKLSTAIREYYPGTRRCPTLVRALIRHDVGMAKIALHGPNAMRTAGAFVNRDPNGIASADWDQSDDMTMVNVWWDHAPDSPEGYWFGQGQLLVWIDERSWFAYGSDLISDPYYDAFSIRNSWNTKAEDWGLPRKGLSLERGIWATAKLIVGERVTRTSAVGIHETAGALSRLGLRFHNATHARVKVIERIYGKLQNYFQAAPGYVGRNPITDRYEKVQEQIRMVKAGKAHPSEFFLQKSQWASILDKILVMYNDTPMHGKYHEGRSPKQVYQDKFSTKLVHIPDELAHLFKPEVFIRPVTGNGVNVPLGKRSFGYKAARFGKLLGQRVRIYFDPGNPEIARCTDLDGKNPFVAELEARPFNHDPLPGTLEKAIQQNAAQNRYMKELHRSLKPYYNGDFFSNLFRPVMVDHEAVELANEFSRQSVEINSRRADEQKNLKRLKRVAGTLGAAVPARPKRIEQIEDGLAWEQELRKQIQIEETP